MYVLLDLTRNAIQLSVSVVWANFTNTFWNIMQFQFEKMTKVSGNLTKTHIFDDIIIDFDGSTMSRYCATQYEQFRRKLRTKQ